MKLPYVDLVTYTRVLNTEIRRPENVGNSAITLTRTDVRSCTVIKEFVGHILEVHNGNGYISIEITQDHVGHKLGEFALTKKFGRSIHDSEKNSKKAAKMRRKMTQKKARKSAAAGKTGRAAKVAMGKAKAKMKVKKKKQKQKLKA